ncbi:MAG: ATP-dependent sacrificial sulfur transferase LarE [Clostridia bacterium]|nr:ATP-dependent sacrificial sulfur transferase LarE [Clostridia bacterium]
MTEIREKYQNLLTGLKARSKVAVAFSAGVDSTLLLHAACEALGTENVLAITGKLAAFPDREGREAEDFCRERGIRHITVTLNQFTVPGFEDNPLDRCYRCKKALFTAFLATAKEAGFSLLIEGTNGDDPKGYRPGIRALAELGVQSPLKEAALTKDEIRSLSRELGLPTAAKPSLPCLATRFPYGERITPEKIRMADEGERLLLSLGFRDVRVRCHEKTARIEVDRDEISRLASPEIRETVTKALRELGFQYVTLDLNGFRSGSWDEGLADSRQP